MLTDLSKTIFSLIDKKKLIYKLIGNNQMSNNNIDFFQF